MISKSSAFLHGRILFIARGPELTRFVNESTRSGIVFYKTQKSSQGLRAQVRIKDFFKLRRPARLTHTRVRIVAKYGWPFLAQRWWRRKFLLTGILFIGIALAILSQMILSISISGNKVIASDAIFEAAEKHGLKTWIWQKDADYKNVAKALVGEFPDAAWVGIDSKGTRVYIRIVEKVRPKVPGEAGNLVASKTGLVQELMVIQGIPLIHEGEIVREGQVLIEAPVSLDNSAAIPKPGATLKPKESVPQPALAAKGFARGRVWYSSEASVILEEDTIQPTGQIAKGWGIKFGTRVIMVTTPESPFAQSKEEVKNHTWVFGRNWHFPVEIVSISYKEMQPVHVKRTQEEARKAAEELARGELEKKILPGTKIIEEKVLVIPQVIGSERVRVEVETYEDLAVYPDNNESTKE